MLKRLEYPFAIYVNQSLKLVENGYVRFLAVPLLEIVLNLIG